MILLFLLFLMILLIMSALRGKFAKDYCRVIAKDSGRIITRAIRAKTYFKLYKKLMTT